MRCPRCDGKGYIEEWYHRDNRLTPLLRQCCDISAYSRRVQQLHESPQDAFKRYGKETPIIARHMNVTPCGLEIKQGPKLPEVGKVCPVIPLFPK